MTITTGDLVSKFRTLRANPAAMQRLTLSVQDALLGGQYTAVNATSPFAMLMEATTTSAAAAMVHAETLVQRLYPDNAATIDELYLHMSDRDYLNRFAAPGRNTFTVMLYLDEVVTKAVAVNDGTGNRRLTIPRNMEFNVAGYGYTLQYPINITVMPTGSLSVFYDLTRQSPLQTIENSRVDWFIGGYGNKQFIMLSIPVQQFVITSQTAQLNAVTGLFKEFVFSDQFYYCRVYIKDASDSVWTEIRTTHTEQVYDTTKPTAVLTVRNSALAIRIPQVYFNNGLVKDTLRVDIYTTKGEMNKDFSGLPPTAYSARWIDLDQVGDSPYIAPFYTFSGLLFYTENPAVSGKNGLSFSELRERVITNGLDNPTKPITDEQLSVTLSNMGYNVLTNVDNITDRQVLAIRELQPPESLETVTGMGCSIKLLQTRLSDLVQQQTVENHGARITIRPNTLFRTVDGVLTAVPDAQRIALGNSIVTPPDVLANQVNDGNYYYTPFHYVLDTTNNQFDTRVYRMDQPKANAKYLYMENTVFGLNTSTNAYGIAEHPSGLGYRITIQPQVSELYSSLDIDQLFVQLSYLPPGSSNRVWINGVLQSPIDSGTNKPINNQYVYSFDLTTRYDIDAAHLLLLEDSQSPMDLTTVFDLVYIVRDFLPVGAAVSDIDDIVNATVLPNYQTSSLYRGFVQEKLSVTVGVFLNHMWTRSRTVVEDVQYQRYAADVPATYTEIVYQRDSIGNIVLNYDTTTQDYTYTILHQAGDAILDGNGLPVYRHRKGDVVLDTNGQPLPVGGTQGVLRQIDMFLVDGRYYFASNETTVTYRASATDQLAYWATSDLDTLAAYLLERSELYFYPKQTAGLIDVIVRNNERVQIAADQVLRVELYVRQDVYDNEPLRANLEQLVPGVIATSMRNTTISVSEMTERLREALGSDVLSVTIGGFTNDVYGTVTVVDSSMSPSVGKRLTALSNKTLAVRDAIVIKFVSHLPKTV